jgi:alkanesulfonate monooxygenase SsuD/methylene tetrahydromethanopterin reductase-like flavin-dependent oxidoreductase (luciferase family)
LAESLNIVKSLLSGETVNGSGPLYDVVGAEIYPRLARRPPILVAGIGDRLLSLAAKQADIVGLGVSPKDSEDSLREKIEWIRHEAGDRFDDLEISFNLQAVVGDGPPNPRVRERLRYIFRMDLDELVRNHSPVVASGTVDEMCEQLVDRRARLGISYVTLADDLMEDFAPVVERLAGR